MNFQPHKGRPDIDNLIKSLLDSIFDNDAHVWDIRGTKIWGKKGGVEIHKT